MTIRVEPNKSFVLHNEIRALKAKWSQSTALKTLFTTAFLIVGVAAIVFMSSNFLSIGISIVLISSLAIYQFLDHHRHTQRILSMSQV